VGSWELVGECVVCVCALPFLCAGGWGLPCVAVSVVALAVSLCGLVLSELEARRIALAY
jgi:hypothetical protein